MHKNEIFQMSQTIPVTISKDEITKALAYALQDFDKIYSYLVYANYEENKLVSWTIKYSLNEDDEYNTLSSESVIQSITSLLLADKSTHKRIIGYKQPSLEIMIKLYSPLIQKLSKRHCSEWPILDYDDCISICYLTLCKLYNKGYYIHKYLVEKSVRNEILLTIRKDKFKPETISIDDVFYDHNDDKAISLADTLADDSLELAKEEEEHDEQTHIIFCKVKDLIIDIIGERQFEQLFRDYANKHTTAWSRKKMQQIKHKLQKLGIDKNKLGGI